MKLLLHSDIYTIENIEQTKVVYNDFAKIDIVKEGEYWAVYFFECQYDDTLTCKAFENYLIGLENS